MLVLSRRRGESIIIPSGKSKVRVTVSKIQGSRVVLTIESPDDVVVLRAELLEGKPDDETRGVSRTSGD